MDRQVLEKVLGAIGTERVSMPDFARLIQRTEGNFDCFGTAVDGVCDQEGCLWRRTCFDESAAGKRLS